MTTDGSCCVFLLAIQRQAAALILAGAPRGVCGLVAARLLWRGERDDAADAAAVSRGVKEATVPHPRSPTPVCMCVPGQKASLGSGSQGTKITLGLLDLRPSTRVCRLCARRPPRSPHHGMPPPPAVACALGAAAAARRRRGAARALAPTTTHRPLAVANPPCIARLQSTHGVGGGFDLLQCRCKASGPAHRWFASRGGGAERSRAKPRQLLEHPPSQDSQDAPTVAGDAAQASARATGLGVVHALAPSPIAVPLRRAQRCWSPRASSALLSVQLAAHHTPQAGAHVRAQLCARLPAS